PTHPRAAPALRNRPAWGGRGGGRGGVFLVPPVAAGTARAARQRILDFTQPFYTTGLGIAVSTREENRWLPIFRTFLSFGFLQAIVALVGIAMGVGILVWLCERRHNDNFGGGVAKGLGSSFWWSAIALTQAE